MRVTDNWDSWAMNLHEYFTVEVAERKYVDVCRYISDRDGESGFYIMKYGGIGGIYEISALNHAGKLTGEKLSDFGIGEEDVLDCVKEWRFHHCLKMDGWKEDYEGNGIYAVIKLFDNRYLKVPEGAGGAGEGKHPCYGISASDQWTIRDRYGDTCPDEDIQMYGYSESDIMDCIIRQERMNGTMEMEALKRYLPPDFQKVMEDACGSEIEYATSSDGKLFPHYSHFAFAFHTEEGLFCRIGIKEIPDGVESRSYVERQVAEQIRKFQEENKEVLGNRFEGLCDYLEACAVKDDFELKTAENESMEIGGR